MKDPSFFLSDRIKGVPGSGIRKFFDIAAEMKDVISLGIGEPDFVTPWHIRDAGIYSLEQGHTYYTSNSGIIELRKEVARYLGRRFELEYDPKDEIVITIGGSEAIDNAVRAVVNPGDEVIIPEPSFVCYSPIVTFAGGTPVIIETNAENEFRLTAAALKEKITPKTRMLILPYPNNPTGAIMEKKDLEEIAAVLRDTDIFILSDEIYAELTYGQKHVSIASLPGMKDRCVVVNGFSKSYAMTGWRLGYACGPKEVIAAITKIHQYAIMSAPTTSQFAAIEALANGDEDIELMRDEYDSRRKLILEGVKSIGFSCFEPKGAFYIFPCISSSCKSSYDFCEGFILDQKVAVVPGSAFGSSGEGFVRCCYAASAGDISKAIERMKIYADKISKKV